MDAEGAQNSPEWPETSQNGRKRGGNRAKEEGKEEKEEGNK